MAPTVCRSSWDAVELRRRVLTPSSTTVADTDRHRVDEWGSPLEDKGHHTT